MTVLYLRTSVAVRAIAAFFKYPSLSAFFFSFPEPFTVTWCFEEE
jgi:hypothetical protein